MSVDESCRYLITAAIIVKESSIQATRRQTVNQPEYLLTHLYVVNPLKLHMEAGWKTSKRSPEEKMKQIIVYVISFFSYSVVDLQLCLGPLSCRMTCTKRENVYLLVS